MFCVGPIFIRRIRCALLASARAIGLFVAVYSCVRLVSAASTTKPDSPDGSGAFATGHYRNLFLEAGYSQAQIDRENQRCFRPAVPRRSKDTYGLLLHSVKMPMAPSRYITDVAHHDVRTEGMSYGMMISVQLNKKAEFDALWNWAKTYMYISDPKHPSYGYFSWSCKPDGTPNEETPAPDGEEYFAMSLYFASARWGNGKGIYNYKAQADAILTNMRHHPVMSGPTKFGPRTVGSMVNEQYKMIRFVPGIGRGDFTDPSYHLPAFYELWARWGPAPDRAFWAEAAAVSRGFFPKATNPNTGLAPDYANFDGTPHGTKWNPHGCQLLLRFVENGEQLVGRLVVVGQGRRRA